MAKLKVNLKVEPTSGEPTNQEVEVEPTHATVGAVLAAAGKRVTKKWQLWVGSTPATVDSVVPAGAEVRMTEAVRGS